MPPTPDGGAPGDATFQVGARIQMGPGSGFGGGRLDVNVFVPPGVKLESKILDATSASTDEGIERRLDAFFQALSKYVGIDRGIVTFLPAKAKLQFIDDETLLVDAFSASSGRPDAQALNVVLTNGIEIGDISAWGIAPGIPGAATRMGTPMSGLVLAIGDTPAIGDGLTILHEAGHFIGLNHTTEFSGSADPLSDTPKCDNISLDDPTTFEACPDYSNIMFPAFYGTVATAVDVSAAQRAIYRGSPIYKAYKSTVPMTGTMSQHTSGASLASLARPGERTTLTKSGRALTPVERWLSAALCSHAKPDVNALARAKGRDATIAALRAAAADVDLPRVMRRRATTALRALGALPAP